VQLPGRNIFSILESHRHTAGWSGGLPVGDPRCFSAGGIRPDEIFTAGTFDYDVPVPPHSASRSRVGRPVASSIYL